MRGDTLTSSSFSSAVSRNRSGRKGFTPLEFSTLKIFSDGQPPNSEWFTDPGWVPRGSVAEPRPALNRQMLSERMSHQVKGPMPTYTQEPAPLPSLSHLHPPDSSGVPQTHVSEGIRRKAGIVGQDSLTVYCPGLSEPSNSPLSLNPSRYPAECESRYAGGGHSRWLLEKAPEGSEPYPSEGLSPQDDLLRDDPVAVNVSFLGDAGLAEVCAFSMEIARLRGVSGPGVSTLLSLLSPYTPHSCW
ncbi:hypothetical protein Cadr_000029487 [Camelus dromedarius]|uniref:Uncharacterized protein n=1 Tax=Camelus dromedarius TaxID=9838 RepID=A0A5N4C6N0_CAMDR|nr:hypothetical protein Cadr_000029487 [Camelus dromedarius]